MPASSTTDADLLTQAIAERAGLDVDELRVLGIPELCARFLSARPSHVSGVWQAPAPDPAHDWLDDSPTPVIAEPTLERLSKE